MLEENRERALQFIAGIEAEMLDASAYQIANELRRYTRKSYNNLQFAIATLSPQDYRGSQLDLAVDLSGEEIDLAHFIASLSDRVALPGLAAAVDFATAWTAKHSSWSGDLGQAIDDWRKDKFTSFQAALNADASYVDLASNIAAFQVGEILNRSDDRPVSIAKVIRDYHRIRYPEHVRDFIRDELGGAIELNTLSNPQKVEAKIRRSIAIFLAFLEMQRLGKSPDKPEAIERAAKILAATSGVSQNDLLSSSLYFLKYLLHKGELNGVCFKPYKNPFWMFDFAGWGTGEPVRVDRVVPSA
ncbi:hypothetical protein [Oxynema aestuarii]|uniref:Uncharacterized protein n=1 Tax=Oxynema aestuarii AP17 TaxID=2064643 RepID=A0A6H1TXL0_9CYAN|nr:hypothetical protein [Oxynema aestuarii]QIZ70099.1 hypothetical protein HCG48_05545 [Oxynema aestuarii AP17]